MNENILPISSLRYDLDVGVIYTGERLMAERLLRSLRDSCGDLRMRLLLVDNCSGEDLSPLQECVSHSVIVPNERRLHYAANLNRIMRVSTAKYVLLLNTDMYFEPQESCLAKTVAFMEENPECGVSGCRLYHADGTFAFPARGMQSLSVVVARRLGLGRWMRSTLDRYFYLDRPIDSQFECEWLSGCFLMMRRDAYEDVGAFDEGFEKYFEDVDMCVRMTREGWKVMYNGQTFGYHLEQRSSKKLFSLDARRHLKSYMRWLWKWGFAPDFERRAEVAPSRRAA